MLATALFEMRGKITVKKITLWNEKKDFFYVEKSRSFCAKSQRTETEKCWAGLHTPSRALHSLLVPQASSSGDKTRERGERRRGDGSRAKERRGEGKVGRGEWRKGQEIRGRWRSRKGGGEEVRSSRKIKYIPKHILFTRKKTEIRKRVVVLQIFPCAINTLNTTVTRFFAAWAILKGQHTLLHQKRQSALMTFSRTIVAVLSKRSKTNKSRKFTFF